ncbi:MAG: hypothetical protein KZQ64_10850 [gamma proteobacterium symbiont of Bathyaustriella thionipta]|nr:hypothetical protein [gamma proteobacterium symbiont of Bathyaustriella thionipta]MCU7948695.1 hypothetical protein [gamma proteobacterium symbiont of Bathyaustriella thionipta]MCU7953872.1 hypothetical protein [gamma proteobacterium symbiont of Bathyaustriella thionipta]MCU7955032.1 hypothetical protein [gamma proteobacterium symbiont of Bathyaustriella thionipta]MCU7968634.1 hypothetical protein [gamma proteobacterium symbiont of Bathyaustriella thionipta]
MLKQKINAFLLHLAISASVISAFVLIVWFIWYPAPFLYIEGGFQIIMILVGVDVILGPLLTLIIYKPGKKWLVFDLSVIAAVQIAALIYGTYTIYLERPQYIVFTVDRFNLIAAGSIDTSKLQDKTLESTIFDQPKFIFALQPENTKMKNNVRNNAFAGGKDIDRLPEHYRQYTLHKETLLNNHHQLKLSHLLDTYPDIEEEIKKIEISQQMKRDAFIFYPLTGKKRDLIIILNNKNAQKVGYLDVDPWNVPWSPK